MMKKIMAMVRAAVWHTPCNMLKFSRPRISDSTSMRKPPTAPASLGVATPNRIEPLIPPISKTGGMKALRISVPVNRNRPTMPKPAVSQLAHPVGMTPIQPPNAMATAARPNPITLPSIPWMRSVLGT